MPMITAQLSAKPDARLAREVAETLTVLTAELLGKDADVTAVAVEFVEPRFWFLAGKSAEELDKVAFFVDVRITDGTNSKDEKARYIAEVFKAFGRLVKGVHEESYIHVDDLRADAYGYGGLTSERRYVQAKATA